MPSSSRTIPGTVNQHSIGRATVHVCGQTGNRTNAGQAITPFMFNEEYCISLVIDCRPTRSDPFVVCSR